MMLVPCAPLPADGGRAYTKIGSDGNAHDQVGFEGCSACERACSCLPCTINKQLPFTPLPLLQGVVRLPGEGGLQQTFTAELLVDGQSRALGTIQVAELHKVGMGGGMDGWVGGWVGGRVAQQVAA